ncbi:Ig-like domain-containing protein [Duganella sp.]|uniref:Ig-like domain-containing protein n=1 Tax=Duganella sp. TaxID=1904440 RepID=UPI0031D6892D
MSTISTSTQNRLTITGRAEPGAYVTLYDGEDMVGLAVTNGAGIWSTTTDKLADGLHAITAVATDVAGNISVRSDMLYVDITAAADATPNSAIAAPLEVGLGFDTDTGASSTDHVTSVALPVYVGAARPGSFVELVIDGVKGKFGSPVDADGNWSARGEILSEGVHTISIIEHDSDGNTSAPSTPMQLTIDTTKPQPSSVALAPRDGDTATVTHTATPEMTGTAEPGAQIVVYDSDYFLGNTKIGSTVADSNGHWSIIPARPLADGSHKILVQSTDLAGNYSFASPLTFNIDTNAPKLVYESDSGLGYDQTTNHTKPSIYGTAAAGTSVVLYDGADVIGTGVAGADGIWTITPSKLLADGQHQLVAQFTDGNGNALPASGTLELTIDTKAPATATVKPALDARDDYGSSDSDQITNVSTLAIFGQTENDHYAIVHVYVDGVEQYLQASVAENGDWSSVLYDLSDGVHHIAVATEDQAGNLSGRSPETIITVDTKAPNAPPAPRLDSPANATPRLAGKAEAGATITLYDGATAVGSTVADSKGAWSITASTLADGKHSFTVTATDVAGNTSKASAALSVTTDGTADAAPTALDLHPTSDKGGSNSDNLTSLATPTIGGKAVAGSTVLLFDGATQVGKASANSSGAWSITSSKLADGVHHLTAVSLDAVGNQSAASGELVVTIDTRLPDMGAPVLDALSDSGRSNSDGVTNVATPHLSGTAEAGATVTVYDGGAVIGTAVANDQGAWSLTSKALAAGAHNLTAKATDAAGNVSNASAALVITVDIKAPSAPAALDLAAAADSGASSTDNLTSVTKPVVSGKAEANAIVALYDGATLLGSVIADKNGAWSITSSEALADGVHNLTATATDVAGNTSLASSALKVTIDTTTAAPFALDLAAATDKGVSNTDNITNVGAPVIAGKAEAGAAVTLYDGATVVGKTTANSSGVWSITSSKLADAEHHLTAVATDAAGNVSQASAELVVTVDTKAVQGVAAPLLDTQSDSGRSQSDGVTNIATPKVSGATEAGASVALYDGSTLVGTALAGDDGAWSITSKTLSAGAHKLTVKVTDIAGNVSGASPVLSLTVDHKAPNVPTALNLLAILDSGASNTDNKTAISTPTISGKAEANAIVALYDGDTLLGTALADNNGAWKIASTLSLATGTHSLTAKATDVAGNISLASGALNLVIDPTATGQSLAGTSAADSFLLNSEAGAIKVSGFSAAGGDHLLLAHDYNGRPLDSVADVLSLGHVDGKNFVIDFGAGHEITLVGVTSLAESAIILL